VFNLFKRKHKFFTDDENHLIVKAIRHAEEQTSGEVRVYVESKCRFMDAIDRAAELFYKLKMDKTEQRNAAIVYVAVKDRQLAVFGDEGIHQKVGDAYWNEVVAEMLSHFNKDNYAQGIAECVIRIGSALKQHFPYNKDTDKNELPDEIVFGR